MRSTLVHFRGRYGYPSRRHLGRAVADAKAELDHEDDDVGTRPLVLGEFCATNTQLAIDVYLPLRPDVLHAAASVLHALSRDASCGLVEAICNGHVIDVFPFGEDDEIGAKATY